MCNRCLSFNASFTHSFIHSFIRSLSPLCFVRSIRHDYPNHYHHHHHHNHHRRRRHHHHRRRRRHHHHHQFPKYRRAIDLLEYIFHFNLFNMFSSPQMFLKFISTSKLFSTSLLLKLIFLSSLKTKIICRALFVIHGNNFLLSP